MSMEEQEEQARLERARAIGLFRYMLIREAADPALSTRQRGKLVRAIAAREHADPSGRPVRLTRWTLDRWIRLWQQGGFDALVPSPRQCQPRTPPEGMELAAALKKGNPARAYVDNGSAFVDAWLLRACAKLGIKLVHSQPRRPEGKGEDRTVFQDCAGSVPGRADRGARRPDPGPGRAEQAVHRLDRDGLPRPGAFGDRAAAAGPVGSRRPGPAPRRPRPRPRSPPARTAP